MHMLYPLFLYPLLPWAQILFPTYNSERTWIKFQKEAQGLYQIIFLLLLLKWWHIK